ncbi:MAG: right-handed parallel beta-helix repeat-containing protein [Saprospiraceae bacterium]
MIKLKIGIVLLLLNVGYSSLAQTLLPKILTADLQLEKGMRYLVEDSLWVPSAYRLSIPAGVQIELGEGAFLRVAGGFSAIGTVAEPIVFKAKHNSWKGLLFQSASELVQLQHCQVQDAKASASFIAAFTAIDSEVHLEAIHFSNNRQCVYIEGSTMVRILACQFAADNSKEHLNIRASSDCLVEACDFRQVNGGDAIDFDQVTNGTIANCWLEGGVDDGIDIGEQSLEILLVGNQIFDLFENGITVGEESEITATHNLIVGCAKAVEAKDGGRVIATNNTFDQNDYAFAGFNFLGNAGGGTVMVRNTIVSNNRKALIQGEDLNLEINYSLSNSDFLPGSTNLFADPKYIDSASRDYNLQVISPCIDQGDPTSMLDPDLSRNDIGAFPADQQNLPIFAQNFPNPFDQQTIITYELTEAQQVRLIIYDGQGRQLAVLVDSPQRAGKHRYHWLTEKMAAGIYFYELRIENVRKYLGKAIKL